MPFGAELGDEGTVRFRLWAPNASDVSVVLDDSRELEMASSEGWFEVLTEAGAGTRYRFKIDHDKLVPDPASRFQPSGVHEASEVVDPLVFE